MKKKIKKLIISLLSSGMTQGIIAESLGVSAATISLLKTEQYTSNLEQHLASLETLAEEFVFPDEEVEAKDVEIEETYGDWLAQSLETLQISPAKFAEESKLSVLTINYLLDGTTSNPQKQTRKKIEDTIRILNKNKPLIKPPKESSYKYGEVFSGILFNQKEIDQVPNSIGVYVIHDRRGYPTYVGKGQLKNRLKKHQEHKAFIDDRVAYTFSYVILETLKDTSINRKEFDKTAIWLENIVVKFCGNTVLLNKKLAMDLSDNEE